MSSDEAEAMMEDFDRWKVKKERDAFRHRMEHKLGRKERFSGK